MGLASGQEAALPFNPQTVAQVTGPITQQIASEYPHLAEMTTEHILQPGYDFGSEFETGLTIILDALTRSIPGPPQPTPLPTPG